MEYGILESVRERLENNEDIKGFFTENYPYSTLRFFTGLKPSEKEGTAIPTDLFPYISVSPWICSHGDFSDANIGNTVVIAYGIEDDREKEGVFLGVKSICDLTQIILKAMEKQPISIEKVFGGSIDVHFDSGTMYPFYEAVIFPVIESRRLK